jgi:hypothetical protein
MLFLIRACGLAAALAVAAPALAQESPKHVSKFGTSPMLGGNVPAGYMKRCGAHFVCYTGIPLNCTPDTRPYQSVPDHQCFCLRDGCP